MTKTELFIQLAQPDNNGVSRWVSVSEFAGKYACLTFGNGASWARKESTLAKKPLSKAANDAKRQFCKECRQTGIRYDAKLLGYPISYYSGVAEHHNEENACIGCYWYDPIEFKKHLIERK